MLINKMIAITKYAKQYIKNHTEDPELTMPENIICMYLYFHKNINQSAIGFALGLDKGSVAKTVQRLEENGYLIRETNPKNRRENLLKLTDKASRTVSSAVAAAEEWSSMALKDLEPEEAALFERACDKILAAAEKKGEGEPTWKMQD